MLFSYTQTKMSHLSQPQPNMSSIGEECNSLGKIFLTLLVGNLWVTNGETWKKTIFFTSARFQLKLFYPRKCVNCDKSKFAKKQRKLFGQEV